MKKITHIFLAILALFISTSPLSAQVVRDISDSSVLFGPYFGQKTPGENPEIFAPDILVKSKQAHSNIVFSKGGEEAYWCHNGIWFSKIDGGKWTNPELLPFSKEEYQKPEKLGAAINSEAHESNPFISPNGDYIIFTRRFNERLANGNQNAALFISYKLSDGSWSKSLDLREHIDFKLHGNCAIVSPDGKYLFYLDILDGKWQRYWVSGKIIEDLKTKNLKY